MHLVGCFIRNKTSYFPEDWPLVRFVLVIIFGTTSTAGVAWTLHIICILFKNPADGRRSDGNTSVNCNARYSIVYQCAFFSLLHRCKYSVKHRYRTYKASIFIKVFDQPTNAQVIVLKTILKFTLKITPTCFGAEHTIFRELIIRAC